MSLRAPRSLESTARIVLGAGVVVLLVVGAAVASDAPTATLEQRAAGAHSVVVAKARSVSGSWRENAHGDRIIVSRILLEVEEALKGSASEAIWLDVDGGTLDGLTLRVSGIPLLQPGERAVFFLDAARSNVHTPYLRGQGILPLDSDSVVRGSNLGLNEIRNRVRAAGR
jgi:hypothetical protein